MKVLQIGENRKTEPGFRMAVHIIAVLCLSFGSMAIINEIFSWNVSKTYLCLITLTMAFLCEIVPWKWFALSALAGGLLTTAIAAIFSENLTNGLSILNNDIADAIGRHTGWLIPKYAISSEQTAGMDAAVVVAIGCILLTLMISIMVRQSHLFWMAGWIILLALLVALAGFPAGVLGVILIAAGVLGTIVCRIYSPANEPVCDHSFRIAWTAYLYLAIFAACGCLLFLKLCPAESYRVSSILELTEQKTSDLVHKVRFEKGKHQILPGGEFAKADGKNNREDIALSVTMSKPQSCYLRGFVGSVYTADGWSTLENETYYDHYDLFYWLHQAEFYGNTQLTLAAEQLQEKNAKEDIIISVKNELADSEYLYTPYEMKPESWDAKSLRIVADETLRSSQFFGDREYTCHMSGSLTTDFPSLAARLFLEEQKNQENTYTKNESYYNSYVYDHYTELSRTQKSLLEQELGYAGDQKEGHIDYYSAIEKVEQYLTEHIRYDESCRAVPEKRDFLNYFLTESRTGYDVHYATAATLMFRYYGIPARYVEGYLITPDDEKETTIAIPVSNAHAWTEIYIDRLGWVPIEVTPKYREIMEQPDLTKGLEAGTTQAVRNPQKNNVSLPAEKKTLPELLQEAVFDLLKLIGILFLLFDLLVLLFMLIVLFRRVTAGIRRKYRLSVRDNKKAVLRIMKETEKLMLYCRPELKRKKEVCEYIQKNIGSELEKQYQNAKQIWEKAAYSQHQIEKEERDQVFLCCRQLRKQLMKQAGWYERWIIRYIERLA